MVMEWLGGDRDGDGGEGWFQEFWPKQLMLDEVGLGWDDKTEGGIDWGGGWYIKKMPIRNLSGDIEWGVGSSCVDSWVKAWARDLVHLSF